MGIATTAQAQELPCPLDSLMFVKPEQFPQSGHPGSHTVFVLLTGLVAVHAAVPCAKLGLHGVLGLGSVRLRWAQYEMAGCGSSISCDSSQEQRMAGLDVRAAFVAPVPGP